MKWRRLPRWFRDTIAVVGTMSVLLIIYDVMFAKQVDWRLVPLQTLLALVAVGFWSFFSYRSQAKRQAEAAKQAAEKRARAKARKERAAIAAKEAAKVSAHNRSRNQARQQHRE
ncbi:hypothetical protein FD13_GL000182 [Levilactobacillus senmaizukei DSM 21775 = NBRC 103853]|uniref:Uncharacterized protein n=1 Tax=Levilactobacillus senmaizukei DSM 21775 = NBRC 103853 TaxID=1423803 RepID=A0A0R2DH49_9LACO|nr:hypothetical protein [Levilactobacillus senmaizukei]KRN03394.1 hypothetical protein FD13_GL000182 [Levilactobacillus senmaizukei DSM 21775 = NBRC 103853]